ncbi:unnamed protein product [Caenorhabditis brenneri]
MERLNLPNLKNFYTTDGRSTLYFQIGGVSTSAYCLTVEEVTNFINSDHIKVQMLPGKYCNDSVPEWLEEKICSFQSLADFDTTFKRVFGNVVIGSGDEENVQKLKSVTWIYGKLVIRQTNLTDIDCFDSLENVISLDELQMEQPIQILYNINLKTAVFPRLGNLVPFTGLSFDIRGNAPEVSSNSTFCFTFRKSLVFSEARNLPVIGLKTCEEIEQSSRMDANGGKEFFMITHFAHKSCIFEPYHINSESLKVFPTSCTSVCAYLLIDQYSDVTENQLALAFQNLKVLYGFLHVLRTYFNNLGFLKNLEILECDENEKLWVENNFALNELAMAKLQSTSCSIELGGNLNMTRLGIPNLKNFYKLNASSQMLTFAVRFSAYESCMTVEEITNIYQSNVTIVETISGSYCNETSSLHFDPTFCAINNFSLKSFDQSCQRIFASVLVKNGDEDYVNKLNSVNWIYGDLEIRDTNLTDIDFLNNLEYVIPLGSDPKPSIWIHNNPTLVNMSLPHLEKVKTRSYYSIMMDDNNEALSLNLDVLSLTIIVVFGYKCYVETCKLMHNASQSSTLNKLQSQLFHALVLQTIIPLLLMHLPAAFGFSASFFNVSFELLGDICSFTIYLYPTLDPLPNFFIIKNYREAILGAFQVFKIKIVGMRTTKVETDSAMATKVPSALTLI